MCLLDDYSDRVCGKVREIGLDLGISSINLTEIQAVVDSGLDGGRGL